ncbi:MAG: hypothetical protein ACRD50_14925 [Candidatus Acidiferrales bacterium]
MSAAETPSHNSISLVDKVRRELAQYEHPLFRFAAHPVSEGVEIVICFRPAGVELHSYTYRLSPRDIETSQFPWTFQKQLYDCLHDYVIEMFVCNPQRED